MNAPVRFRVCAGPVRLRSDGLAGRHDDKTGRQCHGSYLPPAGDPPCLPACVAIGTIGWPVKPQRGEVHASTVICDSPSHQAEAQRWVYGITGHEGVFRTFEQARKEMAR